MTMRGFKKASFSDRTKLFCVQKGLSIADRIVVWNVSINRLNQTNETAFAKFLVSYPLFSSVSTDQWFNSASNIRGSKHQSIKIYKWVHQSSSNRALLLKTLGVKASIIRLI